MSRTRVLGKRGPMSLSERFGKIARGNGVYSKSAAAAAIIARTPALRGFARTGGMYTGRFRYGPGGYGYADRPELKFFDTAQSFLVDSTGEVPATGQLNLIPQGITEATRVGRRITIKAIQMRVQFQYNVATLTGGTFRFLLVQDKQCNGANATYSGAGGVLESDSVHAFRNLENTQRFIVHMDKFFSITPQAGVAGAFNQNVKLVTFIKKVWVPIEFDSSATTGAIDTIRSNNFFLLCKGHSGEDDIVTCTGVVRVRYVDN